MNTFLKANCVVIYLFALVSLLIDLPWGSGPIFQKVAAAFLAVHVLEAVFAFKHIKTYKGPLLTSLLLALLFGLLHWLPLAKASQIAHKA